MYGPRICDTPSTVGSTPVRHMHSNISGSISRRKNPKMAKIPTQKEPFQVAQRYLKRDPLIVVGEGSIGQF